MRKITLGNKSYFYPSPTVLVGVTVHGEPNYLNVSYAGIANRSPAMLFISLNKLHYSTIGVKENKAFSVNIPSAGMLCETDYCGLVSGKEVDKSKLFHIFYGISENAPMIEECPINMECEVVQEIELEGSNILFIGRVLESYSSEKYLINGLPDIKKIDPILLSMNDFNYYDVGKRIGKAWRIGNEIPLR